jgi:hypothetical protein
MFIKIELRGDFMSNASIYKIKETIKDLPEDEQEIILCLTEIFPGEEDTINEYFKNELN